MSALNSFKNVPGVFHFNRIVKYCGTIISEGFSTGGAGYVFNRKTLRIFEKALNEGSCPLKGGKDIIFVANCLRSQGVKPVSTGDPSGREAFFILKLHNN